MSIPINIRAFNEMVDEDIQYFKGLLKKDEWNIYDQHIVDCLEMSKKCYAEVTLPSLPDEAWDA